MPKTPRQIRLAAARLTIEDIAAYTGQNVNVVARVVNGEMDLTQSAKSVDAWLDLVEREGLPPRPEDRYQAIAAEQADANSLEASQRRVRLAGEARKKAAAAQERDALAERERATARYQAEAAERKAFGERLKETRLAADLGLSEMSVLAGLTADQLARVEGGLPTGIGIPDRALASYQAAAKLAGGKVAAG